LVERDPALFQAGGGWQVFHQAGGATTNDDAHLVALRNAYQNAGVRAKVVAFCDQMGHAWNAADLALCRGGAGTIAEALGTGTPAVVLPYPHHGDEHQRKNAQSLADAGGAVILTDHADALKTLPALRDTLTPLLRDRAARDAMRDALIALAPMDGAGT